MTVFIEAHDDDEAMVTLNEARALFVISGPYPIYILDFKFNIFAMMLFISRARYQSYHRDSCFIFIPIIITKRISFTYE